jgi:ASC-1-like (ASCH) protein
VSGSKAIKSMVSGIVIKNFSAQFHVQPRYFNLILTGQKTVEGRVAREKYSHLKAGDAIQFLTDQSGLDEKSPQTLEARVISLKKFGSFSEMLSFYGLKNCLPGVESLSEGVTLYHSFPGYESDATALGTLGIEIKVDRHSVNSDLECC